MASEMWQRENGVHARIVRPQVCAYPYYDLPDKEKHGLKYHPPFGCGLGTGFFSVYHGTLIEWDEDFDNRILEFVDDVLYNVEGGQDGVMSGLLCAFERKGTVALMWEHRIPSGYREQDQVSINRQYGDVWIVVSSRIAINYDTPLFRVLDGENYDTGIGKVGYDVPMKKPMQDN